MYMEITQYRHVDIHIMLLTSHSNIRAKSTSVHEDTGANPGFLEGGSNPSRGFNFNILSDYFPMTLKQFGPEGGSSEPPDPL